MMGQIPNKNELHKINQKPMPGNNLCAFEPLASTPSTKVVTQKLDGTCSSYKPIKI
jgi:hypothetical protein